MRKFKNFSVPDRVLARDITGIGTVYVVQQSNGGVRPPTGLEMRLFAALAKYRQQGFRPRRKFYPTMGNAYGVTR